MTPNVLLVDNYDSFTYNLVQALGQLGARVSVRRNDDVSVAQAERIKPTHLMISPGPGRPEKAGNCISLAEKFLERIPVLGVCLGHQVIGAALGARIEAAQSLMHGKTSRVYHDHHTLYEGLPNPFDAGRYHSLAVIEDSMPECLSVSAYTSQGEIMGIRHTTLPVEGVQFHPESILTPEGGRLLRNFLDLEPKGMLP